MRKLNMLLLLVLLHILLAGGSGARATADGVASLRVLAPFQTSVTDGLVHEVARKPVPPKKITTTKKTAKPKTKPASKAKPKKQNIGVSKVRQSLKSVPRKETRVSKLPLSKKEITNLREALRAQRDLRKNIRSGQKTGPGRLTIKEASEIQRIANKYKTSIEVVGSRANGEGRNIDQTHLPVGKGPKTRSDIDMRISGKKDIESKGRLSHESSNVGKGAGQPRPRIGEAHGPSIKFSPER